MIIGVCITETGFMIKMCILVTFDPVGLLFSVLSFLFYWSKLISQPLVTVAKKKIRNIVGKCCICLY